MDGPPRAAAGSTPQASGPPDDVHWSDAALTAPLRVLRHGKRVIALAILAAAVVAYLSAAIRPERYTATATLLYTSRETAGTVIPPDVARAASTNEGLLSLPVIADRAAARLGGDRATSEEIRRVTSVVSEPASDLVEIRVTTESPSRSAAIANAYGTAFIAFRRDTAREQLRYELRLARNAEARLTRSERAGPSGEALRDRIAALTEALALNTGGVRLVQPAVAPRSPSSPSPLRTAVLGGLLGAILGFLLAAFQQRRVRTVESVEEAERAFAGTVLAKIPRSATVAQTERALATAEAEPFRVLRAQLRRVAAERGLRSIVIASACPGEGKSTIAWRLAETMDAMGDAVVLVDADMHKDGHGGATRGERPGLSGVLTGAPLDAALEEVPLLGATNGRTQGRSRHLDRPPQGPPTLTVLPSGRPPRNPAELLETARMEVVRADLESRFELVIFDSPPVVGVSDTFPLVTPSSGVVVVSALGRTTFRAVRDFRRTMGLLDGTLIGLVVNFCPADRALTSYYRQRAGRRASRKRRVARR